MISADVPHGAVLGGAENGGRNGRGKAEIGRGMEKGGVSGPDGSEQRESWTGRVRTVIGVGTRRRAG